jgi:hypothetical protein
MRGRRPVRTETRSGRRCGSELNGTCAGTCHGWAGGGNSDRGEPGSPVVTGRRRALRRSSPTPRSAAWSR